MGWWCSELCEALWFPVRGSVLPADQLCWAQTSDTARLPNLWFSKVVYEAQRSFHTTQITNLTVPLSTALLNWFLPIMWLQWCQFFFFFNFLSNALPSLHLPSPKRCKKIAKRLCKRKRETAEKVTQNLIISMIFADLVQLESGCCYLWFWEPRIILIKISLLLI